MRACAAWIPGVHSIEAKAVLACVAWQSALTGDALRARVFELRFPSRLDGGRGRRAAGAARCGGGPRAVGRSLPGDDGRRLLAGPGPSARDLPRVVRRAGRRTVPTVPAALRGGEDSGCEGICGLAAATERPRAATIRPQTARRPPGVTPWQTCWDDSAAQGSSRRPRLGVPRVVPPGRAYAVPTLPARDKRYFPCRFYWPDTVDPAYPYGEGVALQVRVAVSHLNEAWAVETPRAARCTSSSTSSAGVRRRCRPLDLRRGPATCRWAGDGSTVGGSSLRACRSATTSTTRAPGRRRPAPPARHALGFFETKNIGKKSDQRPRVRRRWAIELSERVDMEFDWADEIDPTPSTAAAGQLGSSSSAGVISDAETTPRCSSAVRSWSRRASPPPRLMRTGAIRGCADRLVAEAESRAARPV
ncbi:MAG: hypothetical protein WKG07_36080 [Hymenobacter sp.]